MAIGSNPLFSVCNIVINWIRPCREPTLKLAVSFEMSPDIVRSDTYCFWRRHGTNGFLGQQKLPGARQFKLFELVIKIAAINDNNSLFLCHTVSITKNPAHRKIRAQGRLCAYIIVFSSKCQIWHTWVTVQTSAIILSLRA